MRPLRLLLVDDHVLFRKGLEALLSSRHDFEIVGEAEDGIEARALAREKNPDVVLMDIAMPKCNGIEAVRAISGELPHIQVVMLTVSDDDKSLFEAIKAGAVGYLLKNTKPHQLFDALEGMRHGELPIPGRMAARILREFRQPTQPADKVTLEPLTGREVEVLDLVVRGQSNKEIAGHLFVTENTVKIHLRNIMEKLHLQNRVQAAVYAVRSGLVEERHPPLS